MNFLKATCSLLVLGAVTVFYSCNKDETAGDEAGASVVNVEKGFAAPIFTPKEEVEEHMAGIIQPDETAPKDDKEEIPNEEEPSEDMKSE